MNHSDTVILGAGLAGLGCARKLPGARIFEAKGYAGGHAYSHRVGGFAFDEGAHICHSRDQDYLDLIYRSAGRVHQISASKVLNLRRGAWLTYPVHNHLHELPPRERIPALADFVRAQIAREFPSPANYLEWCRGQYGEFLTREFYAEYTAKYWRMPMERLGIDWLSGRLLPSMVDRVLAGAVEPQIESQAVFAKFHYPSEGGYVRFYDRLFVELGIAYNRRVVAVDWRRRRVTFAEGDPAGYAHLASSLPLPRLIEMLVDAPATLRDAASKLRHTQLLCVNVVVNRPQLTDTHWFYIYDRDFEASRVSLVSNLGEEPAAAHATALQAEIFRRDDESLSVEELVENTIAKLTQCLGFSRAEIVAVQPVLVPHAYVISDVDRAVAVDFLLTWLEEHGIQSMGLLGRWKYIWSDAAFRDGEAAANRILAAKHS